MDQVYEILIHKVHDYEGTVNEFTGDGIMALFGAPINSGLFANPYGS
jgi:class 3 adenylate cyclase